MFKVNGFASFVLFLISFYAAYAQNEKQISWADRIKDEIKRGIDSPEELGNLIFIALQNNVDLAPFYSRREVFSEMIKATGKKNEETAQAAADYWWNDFQKQRQLMLDQFYDLLKKEKINIAEYMLDEVKAIIQEVPGTHGAVKSADIYIHIRKGNKKHVIALDDCGMINGRWYIMTPYIFLDQELK
jgi:predicted HTH domain antitoxin